MLETIDSVAGRAAWTVDGAVATYAPTDGGWTARVRSTTQTRFYAHSHIAIIDPQRRARFVMHASSLAEAVRVAEGHVLGQDRRERPDG